jgi:hypothetical protein
MKTIQALVAIGGQASRLKADRVDVPLSKSFLKVADKPLLYWCLLSLHSAGIRNLVLAADDPEQKTEAGFVISSLPIKFDNIEYFESQGLGVHAIPFHARKLLDGQFVFECGHSITPKEQYDAMEAVKNGGCIVFSAFNPHPKNPRYPIRLVNGRVKLGTRRRPGSFALAHPLLVDKRYAETLPKLNFSIVQVINHYAKARSLRYVVGHMPPEFDTREEYDQAIVAYERWCSDHVLVG